MPFVVAQKETQALRSVILTSFCLLNHSFFLLIAGGNKPGLFCWGRLASPGHSSLFCFKRARLSSLSSLPCSPTPGAMLASAASSPGDWANVSWLHLAVFLWYGHITSAWAHVTLHLLLTLSSLLPSMFFLLLSPPFLSDVMICCSIFWQRRCHTFVSDNRPYYKISRSGQFSPTGNRKRPPPPIFFLLIHTPAFEFLDNRLWLLAARLWVFSCYQLSS